MAPTRLTGAPWRVSAPVRPPITRIKPEAAQRPVLRGPNGRIIDVASLIG